MSRRAARAFAAPLAWMALIYFLSARPDLPSAPSGWLDWAIKKGLHAAGYGVLALLWRRALRRLGVARAGAWALAVAVLYAVSDEWHQTFVPGRHGRASDVLVDALGALAALLARRAGSGHEGATGPT